MQAVSAVLPFRVNDYVLDRLIDWPAVPNDPIYRLVFPQPDMLSSDDLHRMRELLSRDEPLPAVERAAAEIRSRLNPHPGGQLSLNVPTLAGSPLRGLQHKYQQTVLFFPSTGQTCHAYCGYCFRWAQFVGDSDLKISAPDVGTLVSYLDCHPEVTDVLVTGGDPMIMSSKQLGRIIYPLLDPRLTSLRTIRIGTKAPAYWPQRFVTDRDADDLLRLFEAVGRAGKRLIVVSHYTHPRELEPDIAREAVRRIRDTGAAIYCQAPLVRRVNDSSAVWAELWMNEYMLGCVPYYMFVERDTGPKQYFQVPLDEALRIFRHAYGSLPGLLRTVRGPVMSTEPGKIIVTGIATVAAEKVFCMQFIQARDPAWVGRPFFASHHPHAAWIDDLSPAFGEREFFFEEPMREFSRTVPVSRP